MLMINHHCYWAACLPYGHCWWVTFWLIWQGFPGGMTAGYDYRMICWPTITFTCGWRNAGSLPGNHRLFKPGCARCLIICWCEKDTNKRTSWEQLQQIQKKHVDELMNAGQREQTWGGERGEVVGLQVEGGGLESESFQWVTATSK